MRTLTDDDRRKVVFEAIGWLDVPYVLMGNTKEGVDCSQLVMKVYKNALGISLISDSNLPFLASWLFLKLRIIPVANLKIGDLVFYCYESHSAGRIATHVAIYIGGDEMIHASMQMRKVSFGKLSDYPGVLLTAKDSGVIAQWQQEINDLFPNLSGRCIYTCPF